MDSSLMQFLVDLGFTTENAKDAFKTVDQLANDFDQKERQRQQDNNKAQAEVLSSLDSQTQKEQDLLDLKKKQTDETEKAAKAGGGGQGGGFFGGLSSGIGDAFDSSSIGSFVAQIASGTAVFELARKAIDGLLEAGHELVNWFEESIEETGKLQNLMLALDAQTRSLGEDTEEFLGKVKDATHGLVQEHELLDSVTKILSTNSQLSSEQVVDLFKVTTDLARSEGKDVSEAMDTVTRALTTGRFNMLAYRLELGETAKARLADTSGMEANAKAAKDYTIVLEEETKALERRGGAPPINYEETITQLERAVHGFQEEVGIAIVTSDGFKRIQEDIRGVIEFITEYGPKVAKIIGNIADEMASGVFSVFEQTWELLKTIFEGAGKAIKLVSEALKLLTAGFVEIDLTGASGKVGLLKTLFVGLAETIATVNLGIKETILSFNFLYDAAKLGLGAATDKFKAAQKDLTDKYFETIGNLNDELKPKVPGEEEKKKTTTGTKPPPEIDPQYARKVAEARLKAAQAAIEAEAAVKEAAVKKEKELDDELYKNHQINLDDYLKRQKNAAEEEYEIAIKKNLDLLAIQKQQLQQKDRNTPEILAQDMKALESKNAQAVLAIQEKLREDLRKLSEQKVADDKSAAQERELVEVQLAQKILQTDEKILEERFKKGEVPPDKYLEQRLANVQKEKDLAIQTAQIKFKYAEDNAKDLQQLDDDKLKAQQDAADKSLEIERNRLDTIHTYQENQYKKQLDLIKSQENVPGANRSKVLQEEIDLTSGRVDQLMRELFTLKAGTDEYDKQKKLLNDTLATLGQMVNKQLQLADAASQTGSIISKQLSNFTSLKDVATAITTGFSVFDAQSQYRREAAQAGISAQSPFAALFEAAKPDELGGVTKDSAERLREFNVALKGAVGAVGGLVSAFTNASGGFSGAVGGGIASAGFASSLSGIKGLSFLGGPIAQIGIGVAGAIFGGIVGAAKKHTEEAAQKLSTAFDGVVKALGDGSIQLKDAIQKATDIRQQTVSQLSGRKGGREQLDKLLPGMDQQIDQLKQKQKSLTDQLTKDLTTLQAPSQYESIISSLDSIVTKYQEYAGAVNDTSKAQEFLNLSVQRYIEQQETSLRQSEEQAIQDAIQLNDLYTQRQQILDQAANQEYGVLTQGILTRQLTTAQTKGGQIQAIEDQKNQQIAQIDQQIELTKTKVDAERQIFDIASDRVSMETQLLQLQKQQTMDDMARIAALAGLVADLKSGQATPDQITSWINALGSNSASAAFQAQYSTNGRYGYGQFNGNL